MSDNISIEEAKSTLIKALKIHCEEISHSDIFEYIWYVSSEHIVKDILSSKTYKAVLECAGVKLKQNQKIHIKKSFYKQRVSHLKLINPRMSKAALETSRILVWILIFLAIKMLFKKSETSEVPNVQVINKLFNRHTQIQDSEKTQTKKKLKKQKRGFTI